VFHSSSVLFTGDEIKSALLIVHSGPYPSCDVTNFVFNLAAEYLDALAKSFRRRKTTSRKMIMLVIIFRMSSANLCPPRRALCPPPNWGGAAEKCGPKKNFSGALAPERNLCPPTLNLLPTPLGNMSAWMCTAHAKNSFSTIYKSEACLWGEAPRPPPVLCPRTLLGGLPSPRPMKPGPPANNYRRLSQSLSLSCESQSWPVIAGSRL